MSDFVTSWTAACQTSLSIMYYRSLLKLMCIVSVMPSDNLILCRPLLFLPSIFPSISIFSNKWDFHISSVQSLGRVWLFATPWTAAHQASLSITNTRSPPKPMSIVSVIPFNHLIPCHPLLLPPSIFPIIRGVFSNESTLRIRWPKYWSFSFSISPSSEKPGLISFRMDWLDLLAVQATLKSLLQHHNSKASILQHSAFFTVQLSHAHMTTGKTIALTRWTFVGKVMSLLFNMLSRLVITFLPRSKQQVTGKTNWVISKTTDYLVLKKELWNHEKTWKNFKSILLSEKKSSEKARYYIIPNLKCIIPNRRGKTKQTIKRSWVQGRN